MSEMNKKSVQSTAFKKSTYMSILVVIVFAIVVAINVIVSNISDTKTKADISENHIYQIGDTTKGVLDRMTDDVELIIIDREEDVDARLARFVKLYANYSDHVKVTYVDPTLYPSILKKYDVSSDSIVVKCEATEKTKIIAFDDILEYDETYYYYYGTKEVTAFDGEGEITTALDYVTREAAETVYQLTGHGEADLGDGILDMIDRSNIAVKSWSLMMDGTEIPDDCTTLVIYQPTSDISKEELTSLKNYQAKGGNIIVLFSSDERLENLESLMADYGISTTHGYVGDQSRYYQYMQTVFAFFPEFSSGNVTGSLNQDKDYCMVYSPLDLIVTEVEGVTTDAFLKTSGNGLYTLGESDEYETGTYTIAASAVKTENESEGVSSTLTVYGCVSIIADSFVSDSLSNAKIFINSITQYYEAVENISIEAVSLDIPFNTMTNYGYILVGMVLFAILMIVTGIVVWNIRRKL